MKIVGNSRFQKAANSSLILNYLRENKSCSRNQIAEDLGLQPSTVTYIVSRLMGANLVRESEKPIEGAKKSGRKPIRIELIPEFGSVIGLDLQADFYSAVLCDVRGNIIKTIHKTYLSPKKDFKKTLLETIKEITMNLPYKAPILGLGLSLPGTVNSQKSIVKDCWTHSLKNEDLSDFLQENFPFPIILENDANCCAQNILWNYPSIEKEDSFVYLLTRFHNRKLIPKDQPSVGVGMGLVFNRKIYRGFTHEAGEYKSILSPQNSDIKWQVAFSQDEMDRAFKDEKLQKKIIIEIMNNMILILQILNPRAIYLGGNLSDKKNIIDEILESHYKQRWTNLKNKGCQISVVSEGDLDPAKGAAAFMLSALYSIPQIGKGGKSQWETLLSNVIKE